MNIFYLDPDPKLAAQYHCDKHVVKMPLETAQIISSNIRIYTRDYDKAIYRSFNPNHPSVRWARMNKLSWQWTMELFKELCNEYTHRYNREHKSLELLDLFEEFMQSDMYLNNIPDAEEFIEPLIAMDNDYIIANLDGSINSLLSYQNYYRRAKREFLFYSNRERPPFLKVKNRDKALYFLEERMPISFILTDEELQLWENDLDDDLEETCESNETTSM